MNNNRSMKTFISQKLSSKSLIPKRNITTINSPTPIKPKPLNYVKLMNNIPNEPTTPLKNENKGSLFGKVCSTLGAVEKEKIRQKLILSSNKKTIQPSDSFKLFDNEDYIRGNNMNNRIKVIKMDDFLFDDNNIMRNINFNEEQDKDRERDEINRGDDSDHCIKKSHTVVYESNDRNIINYVF